MVGSRPPPPRPRRLAVSCRPVAAVETGPQPRPRADRFDASDREDCVRTLLAFVVGTLCGAAALYALGHAGYVAVATRPPSVAAPWSPAPVAPPSAAPTVAPLPSITAGPALAAPAPSPSAETPPPGEVLDLEASAATDAAAPPAPASPAPRLSDVDWLKSRDLLVPVAGVDRRALRDDFAEHRGSRVHEAIDIPAPRGTPVLAVDDGIVRKLFNSARGGLTVYQFDPTETYCYYYAHLDRYAEGLAEGRRVRKGEKLGEVGTTGNASPGTPHLHFTVTRLGPEKRWWEGAAINPFPAWAAR